MALGSACPKCSGRMEEGYTPDRGYGENHVTAWHPGAPDKRWWGLRIDKKAMRPITALRCTRCGFLEHYAK